MSFRWFVPNNTGGVYLVAEHYDGAWHVSVTSSICNSSSSGDKGTNHMLNPTCISQQCRHPWFPPPFLH